MNNNKGFMGIFSITIIIMMSMATLYIIKSSGTINNAKTLMASSSSEELNDIGIGLGKYYDDVGLFPTTAIGLRDLIYNASGSVNWAGPYLSRSLSEIESDGYGTNYVYYADNTAGISKALVISPGQDTIVNPSDYGVFSFSNYPFTAGSDDIIINIIKP